MILFTPREILALVLKEIISIILDICQLILFKQIFLMGKKSSFCVAQFLELRLNVVFICPFTPVSFLRVQAALSFSESTRASDVLGSFQQKKMLWLVDMGFPSPDMCVGVTPLLSLKSPSCRCQYPRVMGPLAGSYIGYAEAHKKMCLARAEGTSLLMFIKRPSVTPPKQGSVLS